MICSPELACLDPLEPRRLLSGGISATLRAGLLSITGTPGPDRIVLRQARGRLAIAGTALSFVSNRIRHISIDGGDGNDTLTGTDGPDSISGGDGNDLIHGNGGRDSLDGQTGMDKLFGDAGDDSILGGAGDDLLVGGNGSDTLLGGEDD